MFSLLESKRINLGLVVSAMLLALLAAHGIALDSSTSAALALGLGGLWTVIAGSDAVKPFKEKEILTWQKFKSSNIGRIAAGAVAWIAFAASSYMALTSQPAAPPEPPAAVVPAETPTEAPAETPEALTPAVLTPVAPVTVEETSTPVITVQTLDDELRTEYSELFERS